MDGKKTTIARNIRHGHPGDRFKVGTDWYEIMEIKRMSLGDVMMFFYRSEGAISQEDFKTMWTGNHRRAEWNTNTLVFLHTFEKVESGYKKGVEMVEKEFQIMSGGKR